MCRITLMTRLSEKTPGFDAKRLVYRNAERAIHKPNGSGGYDLPLVETPR